MSKKRSILILEDDMEQLVRYKSLAENLDYDAIAFADLAEAKKYLCAKKSVDIVITDMHLSSGEKKNSFEGLEFISFLKENCPEVMPIAMSNDPKVDTYQKSMAAGAAHFIKKPIVDENELSLAIETARGMFKLQCASSSLLQPAALTEELKLLCPDGMVLSEANRKFAKRIAVSKNIPTVIFGETGTGKELFAQLIHRERCKNEGVIPLVCVNCGNIDENMAASLLFGHVKGSFTGAVTTTPGYVGQANGGILFLDEVHCLTKNLQQRLLRVLNDGSYERLGDSKQLHSDFQIICATTKDLYEETQAGSFLLDLQIRLEGHNLTLLPLRKRKEDIPTLIKLFFAKENVAVHPEELAKIIERCQSYYWQGNIRLLHRAIQSLIGSTAMCGEPVTVDMLPEYKSMLAPNQGENATGNFTAKAKEYQALCKEELLEKLAAPMSQDCNLNETLEMYEMLILKFVLERSKSNLEASTRLHIPRSTFEAKRKKYNI